MVSGYSLAAAAVLTTTRSWKGATAPSLPGLHLSRRLPKITKDYQRLPVLRIGTHLAASGTASKGCRFPGGLWERSCESGCHPPRTTTGQEIYHFFTILSFQAVNFSRNVAFWRVCHPQPVPTRSDKDPAVSRRNPANQQTPCLPSEARDEPSKNDDFTIPCRHRRPTGTMV